MPTQVVIQQSMLDLIERLLCWPRQISQTNPDRYSASDVIALDARFSTLAVFNAGQLFDFAVKLLDFPAHATHLLCGIQAVMSQVAGDDPVCAVRRHYDPEQFYLGCFWKAFDLDDFAMYCLLSAPRQRVDALIGRGVNDSWRK